MPLLSRTLTSRDWRVARRNRCLQPKSLCEPSPQQDRHRLWEWSHTESLRPEATAFCWRNPLEKRATLKCNPTWLVHGLKITFSQSEIIKYTLCIQQVILPKIAIQAYSKGIQKQIKDLFLKGELHCSTASALDRRLFSLQSYGGFFLPGGTCSAIFG